MKDNPCLTAERELLEASTKLVEATNKATQLLDLKPFGWQDALAEASNRKARAQNVFQVKTNAYLKCREQHPGSGP